MAYVKIRFIKPWMGFKTGQVFSCSKGVAHTHVQWSKAAEYVDTNPKKDIPAPVGTGDAPGSEAPSEDRPKRVSSRRRAKSADQGGEDGGGAGHVDSSGDE